MEFRFNLNEIFPQPLMEIGNSLIPPGFTGDKRALWDTQSKITQIVNAMGEASAHAQGLTKPITTADRLRNSEHRLYLLLDQNANNGKGAVTGLLKTGEKGLYVFDREGQHYQVSPPCVLDFYIHESRQRSGFGKRLFEHMLQKEQIEPVRMAIDRPSDKLLGFLHKHYGLSNPVKQMNNYVVFDGFFPRSSEAPRTVDTHKSYTPSNKQSANGLQQGYATSPYGRYGAPRPTCSMGQIIHNDSPVIKRNQEPTGVRSAPTTNVQGQGSYGYSNQNASWQTTQSAPNMHYAYSQQQPMMYQQYPQNPLQYNQRYPQSQEASGENYAMARGDAPNSYYQPNMYAPAQNVQYDAQMAQITPQQSINYSYNQQQPAKSKEPLFPQSFDGTVRRMPHQTQSMPVNEVRHVCLQNSPSAPVNYQMPAMPQDSMQAQAYNVASVPQMAPNANEVQQYLQTQSAPQQASAPAPQQVSVPAPQQVPMLAPQQASPPAPQQLSVSVSQQVSVPASQQPSMGVQYQQQQQQASMGYQQMMQPNQAYNMAAAAQMTTQQQTSPNVAQEASQHVLNAQMMPENEAVAQQNQAGAQMMIQRNFEANSIPANQNPSGVNVCAAAAQPYQNQQYYMPQQVQSMPQVAANASSTVTNQQAVTSQQSPVCDQNVTMQRRTDAAPEEVRSYQPCAVEEERRMRYPPEVDLSKGYPPQHHESSAHNTTTTNTPNNKADRPNSLNIEPAEEVEQQQNEAKLNEVDEEEALDGGREDVDSLDGDAVDAIEQEMEKVEIAHRKTSTPLSRGSRSPGIEAAGIVTPGRSTPGLTDQGYFDLKFYHNKLW